MRGAIEGRIGRLLGLANARMGSSAYSRQLYELKDRVLRRYGRLVGEDVQLIVKECWGYEEDGRCLGKPCRRCGGSGVWERKLILLERWELGGRIFHRPARQVFGDGWRVTITGRIHHDGVGWHDSGEAQLWVALLFDRALFWRLLRSSRHSGITWRHPLQQLQRVVFVARIALGRLSPTQRRCWHCDRQFRTWTARYVCFRCVPPWRPIPATDEPDLPF